MNSYALDEITLALDRILDLELAKEIVQNDPVGVECGAGVEALRFAPGEKLLNVLGRALPRPLREDAGRSPAIR